MTLAERVAQSERVHAWYRDRQESLYKRIKRENPEPSMDEAIDARITQAVASGKITGTKALELRRKYEDWKAERRRDPKAQAALMAIMSRKRKASQAEEDERKAELIAQTRRKYYGQAG